MGRPPCGKRELCRQKLFQTVEKEQQRPTESEVKPQFQIGERVAKQRKRGRKDAKSLETTRSAASLAYIYLP